eukprot:gnl/TRDRNA2_/TRDRNA2_179258_c0_seq1.p1 gnl/TRDRNA2_/TRDRNA2_179258_c0~~gnl/TRDRNA2_/TRDRNA2_179258_c0_seq1.p1  ORF type:complete len:327 (+),score=34.44 gnl/TRDRNA2_/TRDRNA2_179258_c0_seq1:83-1063(+)
MLSTYLGLLLFATTSPTVLANHATQCDGCEVDGDDTVMLQLNANRLLSKSSVVTNPAVSAAVESYIDTYFDDKCEQNYGVSKADLKAQGFTCVMPDPPVADYDLCNVATRHLYTAIMDHAPGGLMSGDSTVCLHARVHAVFATRMLQASCYPANDPHPPNSAGENRRTVQQRLVYNIHKRDCQCYADSLGPCGKVGMQDSPTDIANFASCITEYMTAMGIEGATTMQECTTSKQVNPDVDRTLQDYEASLPSMGVGSEDHSLTLKARLDQILQQAYGRIDELVAEGKATQSEIDYLKDDNVFKVDVIERGIPLPAAELPDDYGKSP